LIKDFKVLNTDTFITYLKEIWRDLSERSDDKFKGVNKITFSKYYELPGLISDRLFAVFDKNQNEYLDIVEFIDGMKQIYTENFEKQSKFVFEFYDFNKDGLISKEDIRTMMQYVPLANKNETKTQKYEIHNYTDRVESQEELQQILEKCFKEFNADLIDYSQFIFVIENLCSDIFFFIIMFLLDKRPFFKSTLLAYEKQKTASSSNTISPISSPKRLVLSPNRNSKFSPMNSKSPQKAKRSVELESNKKNNEAKDILNKFVGRDKLRHQTQTLTEITTHNCFEIVLKSTNEIQPIKKDITLESMKIPVNRKNKINLKSFENVLLKAKNGKKYTDRSSNNSCN